MSGILLRAAAVAFFSHISYGAICGHILNAKRLQRAENDSHTH